MKNILTLYFNKTVARGIDLDGDTPIQVEAFARLGHVEYRPCEDGGTNPKTIVAACILQRESFTRWVKTPLSSIQKAEKVIPTLLDIQLPFPLDTCEYSVLSISGNKNLGGSAALVVGARQSDIAARLKALSAAAVDPHILDQEGIALWNQLMEEQPHAGRQGITAALLFFALDRLTISIGQSGQFVSSHSLKTPDMDGIQRILKPYLPDARQPAALFLAGPSVTAACTPPFLSELASSVPCSSCTKVGEPRTFLARACARRALLGFSNACNLRTGIFLNEEHKLRIRRRPRNAAIALLLAGLSLWICNGTWLFARNHLTARMQYRTRQLAESIVGNPRLVPKGQELLAARRAIAGQAKAHSAIMAPFQHNLGESLRIVLSTLAAHRLSIEAVHFSHQAFLIHGTASEWTACEQAAASLAKSGWSTKLERKENTLDPARQPFVLRISPLP